MINGSSVPEFSQSKPITKANDDDSFRENPFTFLAADDPILLSCMFVIVLISLVIELIIFASHKLKLTSAFPAHNVLVRNPAGQPARSLYLTNDIVKRVVLYNDYRRLRLTSCGTKVFMKQEGGKGIEAQFRVLGEGLPVVLPFVQQDTIIEGSLKVLETLIRSLYPLINAFEEPFKKVIEDRGKLWLDRFLMT
jgi:multisite-specific tRNA:(cytosine-C5)-methyltransferase